MKKEQEAQTLVKRPVVALAGRPNVGKSTLFNRLARQRRAITDPTPGVTRDPVGADVLLGGRPVRLVDTGGFKLDREAGPQGALEAEVVARALETLEKADLVLLIFEAGVMTAEDEEFIGLLRPFQKKMVAVVNKTEGGRREAEGWNLLAYGFPEVFFVSAEHGDNVGALEAAILSRLDFSRFDAVEAEEERPVRIAILGKPNTGKSTLSNRLTGSASSIVSDIPGTTRDVVEGRFRFKGRAFEVLDTAGIRRRSRVTENVEYYSVNRALRSMDRADVVFLLIDAREGLSEQDKKIAAQADKRGRGIILALNKWDAVPQVKNALPAARDRIHFLFGQAEWAPVVPVSALTGAGVEELLDTAVRVYRQLNRRVETAVLNQALEKWLAAYPPPVGPQTRFKIRYGVQLSANPVRFAFFASRPQAVGEAYRAYLKNRLRRDLGYSLIPLEVDIRGTHAAQTPERERETTAGGARRPERKARREKKSGGL